ncbi:MAG: hypothetical protein MJ193_00320 [Clostridia bacterium]|nr:hypothetical protein [Clostridia bacterium]
MASGTYAGMPIVFTGYVQVYDSTGSNIVTSYNVTIASNNATYALQKVKDRKTVYALTAHIGAVVDSMSRVVDAEGQITYPTSGTMNFTLA